MRGVMLTTVKEAGTLREIQKGTLVRVYWADNLPADSPFKYYVSPVACRQSDETTMAVYESDVIII